MSNSAVFSASVITPSGVSANSPAAMIRPLAAPGAGARPRIRRIKIVVHASPTSSSAVEVYRLPNANIGTATTQAAGQGMNSADTAATKVDTAWSSVPTLPGGAVSIAGSTLGGAIGNGDVITFPDPLELEPGTGLVLWCPSAASQLRIVPEWTE